MAKDLEENFDAMLREFDSDWKNKKPAPGKEKQLRNPQLPSLENLDDFEIPSFDDEDNLSSYEELESPHEETDFEPVVPVLEDYEETKDFEEENDNKYEDEKLNQEMKTLEVSEEDLNSYERDRYMEEDEADDFVQEFEEDLKYENSFEKEYEESLNEDFEEEFDYEEEFEYDYEEETESTILPGINADNEKPDKKEPPVSKKPKLAEGNSEGSSADEKAKAFFVNLKDKAKGLFKKKSGAKKEKPAKLPKKTKQNETKKKVAIPKLDMKKISKKQKIVAAISILLLVVVLAFFVFSGSSYKSLGQLSENTSATINGEEIKFTTSSLVGNGETLNATFTNTGDISSNASIYITLYEKSRNPFGGSIIKCKSDIINLEGTSQQDLSCNSSVNNESNFKIKVEVDDF